MSFNFGKSSQKGGGTQTIQMPAPSADELELRKLNLDLAKKQSALFDKQTADQEAFAASPEGQMEQKIQKAANENIYARLTGTSPVLSPEAQARVNTAYGATQSQGESDLMRFAEQLAGQRGMRLSDSPIGGEALRQRTLFGSQLAGQKAASELDVGNTEANFDQAIRAFQAQLSQQAFMNRLSLSSASPASYGLQSQLFGERLAAAPRSMTSFGSGTQWNTGFDLGQMMYGAGNMGARFPGGGGGLGGAPMMVA